MRLTIAARTILSAIALCATPLIAVSQNTKPAETSLHHGALLYSDDFDKGLDQWKIELERPGNVTAKNSTLDIDVPAGATIWFRTKLSGPLVIEYEATAVHEQGVNDRVSDLNCFWMANDPKHTENIFASPRHGAFAEYNRLTTYYVGLGGNGNTTTRFRRYIGSATDRPLLPENDLSAPQFLLQPNKPQTIELLADGDTIAYFRDHQRLFLYQDNDAYQQGWFAIRTTKSHLLIKHFRVYRYSKPGA